MFEKHSYREIFFSTGKYIFLKNLFMIATAIFSIFIVRLLSPVEYGKWSLVYQLIATIGPIFNLGFLATLAKFIPQYSDIQQKNKLFSQALFTVLIIFGVVSVIYFIGFPLFVKFIPQEIKILKYPFLFFIGAVAFINLCEGYYRGLGKFNQWTIIDGLRSSISAGIAVFFILILARKFEVVFYTYFFIIILFLIFLFSFFKKNIYWCNLKLDTEIIKFSLTMFVGQIMFLVMTNVNPVLLRALLKSPMEVGYYFAGIRISQMFESAVIGQLATPFLYYFTNPNTVYTRERIIEEGTKILGLIFGFFSLILFTFSDEIIVLLFSNVYKESISVMKIYSFWIFLFSLQSFAGPFFLSIDKPLISLIGGSVFFFLNFVFNFIFIPYLKTSGAALSSILAMVFLIIFYFYFYEKFQIKIIQKIKWLMFSVIIGVIIGLFINKYLSPVVFIVIILLTRQFSNDDVNRIKKIILKQG
jgi:O-antigen/teichoic acid export membrane protein